MTLKEFLRLSQQVSIREQLDGLAELQKEHLIHDSDVVPINRVLGLGRELENKLGNPKR